MKRLLTPVLACLMLLATACGGSGATSSQPSGSKPAGSSASATPQGQAGSSAGGKVFTFGGMFPLTGPAAPLGPLTERGAQFAVDQINAAGGVAGWKLKMIAVDHKGTAQGGVQGMSQLANLDHVPFVLSGFAGVLLAAQPVAAQNHVVLVNIGGASDSLLNKPWLYNIVALPRDLDPPLAQWAKAQGYTRAAMLTSDDAYGQDNANAFRQAWTKLGGTIVDAETFPLSATDFTAQLTKIRAANPQVLLTVTLGDTQGLIVKQARGLGITVPVLNPLIDPISLHKVAGNIANGLIGSNIATDFKSSSSKEQAFLKGWQARFHQVPDWSETTPYQAVQVLATLIQRTVKAGGNPRDGSALLKALQSDPSFFNYYNGGTLHLQADHGAALPIAVQKVEGTSLVNIEVVPPKASS